MLQRNGLPGYYGIFEGLGGCGKDSQIELIIQRLSNEFPRVKTVRTFEPGGGPGGAERRHRLLTVPMSPDEQLEGFVEDRKIHLEERVIPDVREGKAVFSSRAFPSNISFQGYGGGLGFKKVWDANWPVIREIPPDMIVFLNVGIEACMKRRGLNTEGDQFDLAAYEDWKKRYDGYVDVLSKIREVFPQTKIYVFNDKEGKMNQESMHKYIWDEIKGDILEWAYRDLEGKIISEGQPSSHGRERI